MTSSRSIQKWGPIILGVICVFIVVRLVGELQGPAHSGAAPAQQTSNLSRDVGKQSRQGANLIDDAPVLRFNEFNSAKDHPTPAIKRNPFGYPPPPPPPGMRGGKKGAGAALPPPPPPIPLKALGYSRDEAGKWKAYLSDQTEVYVVSVGDEVSGHYKILSITPTAVTVEDLASGRRASLPIPVVKP